jgi:HSP20 family protein
VGSEGVLSIRGEKKREEEHHDRNFYRMERSYGEFVRQFTLPEGVKEEDIQADFKDGVLEIMVPKKEPSKPKEREVEIRSGLRTNGNMLSSKNGNGQREKTIA